MRKAFNEAKHTDPFLREWWAHNSKEAYNTGLANAAAAFDNYAKSRRGERRGARMGRPRFKSKRKARPACRFTTGTVRLDDRRHITLPRLGLIRLHEDAQPLVDAIAEGGMRILSVTVRFERGRWFAVVQTEERHTITPATRPGAPDRPRPAAGRKPTRSATGCTTGWRTCGRTISTRPPRVIPAEYGTVVVEALNVKGMVRNRRLSRRISDAAFGELRRQLTYKTQRVW